MTNLFFITLIGTAAGFLGTGCGGLIINLLPTTKKRDLSFVLAFSGGIMLAVLFQDLIPEALNYGTAATTLFGCALGIGFLLLLDCYMPHMHITSKYDSCNKSTRLIRSSILLGIGIAMHNLPEGLAIGAGYVASENLGLGLAFILALHNIPEGMAMAGPMKAAGVKPLKTTIICGLAGIPTGIGALLGSALGSVSEGFLSTALGFAAGAMLYLVFDELLPISQELNSHHSSTFGAVFGVIFGLLFLMLINS